VTDELGGMERSSKEPRYTAKQQLSEMYGNGTCCNRRVGKDLRENPGGGGGLGNVKQWKHAGGGGGLSKE